MPLYAGKHAICALLRNMLPSHVHYKPVSLIKQHTRVP